jgi:hypothetical protein
LACKDRNVSNQPQSDREFDSVSASAEAALAPAPTPSASDPTEPPSDPTEPLPDPTEPLPDPTAPGVPAADSEGPVLFEPTPRPPAGREVLTGLLAGIVVTLAGFPLGWLWSALAPWIPAVRTSDGTAVLAQPEGEQMIADEGWYVFIMIGAGIAFAVLAWVLLRRYRGIAVAVGLALGAVGGGVAAAWLGQRIGRDHFRHLMATETIGKTFYRPVILRADSYGLWHHVLPYARGDVLICAITATLAYLLLAGFSQYPTLRPFRKVSLAEWEATRHPESAAVESPVTQDPVTP